MKNKLLLILIFCSFISVLIGVVSELILNDTSLFLSIGYPLFIISGTFLLVKNGEYLRTKEYRLSKIGISILIIGVMFKIMHWHFSLLLIAIGLLLILFFYILYVLKKSILEITDWIKILYLFTLFLSRFLIISHLNYGFELSNISLLLLSILVYNFIKKSNFIKSNFTYDS